MVSTLSRNWWVIAIRGAFAVLFGIIVFIWPAMSLLGLVFCFAAFAMAEGILALMCLFFKKERQETPWWTLMLEGAVGIGAAVIVFSRPGFGIAVLIFCIGLWAIIRGILEIGAAISIRKIIHGEGWLILAGALSVAFGVLIIVWPAAGALTVAWLIGMYALMYGVFMLGLAFKLKHHKDHFAGRHMAHA